MYEVGLRGREKSCIDVEYQKCVCVIVSVRPLDNGCACTLLPARGLIHDYVPSLRTAYRDTTFSYARHRGSPPHPAIHVHNRRESLGQFVFPRKALSGSFPRVLGYGVLIVLPVFSNLAARFVLDSPCSPRPYKIRPRILARLRGNGAAIYPSHSVLHPIPYVIHLTHTCPTFISP